MRGRGTGDTADVPFVSAKRPLAEQEAFGVLLVAGGVCGCSQSGITFRLGFGWKSARPKLWPITISVTEQRNAFRQNLVLS